MFDLSRGAPGARRAVRRRRRAVRQGLTALPGGILGRTNAPTAPDVLAPQRPKPEREHAASAGYLLEPDWVGRRILVRVGLGEPRFLGYAGPVDAPAALFDAIAGAARCASAVFDGVLVDDFEDERELELDAAGNAVVRPGSKRPIFAAFDLLEIDGASLLGVPLLERKRHLAGALAPSSSVRLTPFVTRGLAAWHDTLKEQGFKRFVLKDPNSTYAPGQTTAAWLVIERIGTQARRGM